MKELDLKVVGHDAVRLDGLEKITATAKYADDIDLGPGMLYAAILGSPYAHATIKSINTSDAEQVPGVHAVLSGQDCPGTCGLYLKDSQLFARDRVRYVGQQVAAVVASSQEIADKALGLIKIEYEPLPVLQDPIEALKPDAVLIHPDLGDYEVVPWLYPQPGTNIAHLRKTRKGDVEKAFEEADYILEDWYHVPHVVHAPIETHVSAALYTFDGRLTMWNSTQSPHTQRNILANALNLKHKDVRIITPYVGGGFGGKAGVNMEVIAAACAMKVPGHPVKIRYSRKDEFQNTSQRQELKAYVKMGVKNDGTIVALKHQLFWDVGASAEYGSNVVNATGFSATGAYRIPNVWIDSYAIYTNRPPCGAYRGFGYSEFHFGIESHIDRIAKALNMDPVEFRKKNAIQEGDTVAYGVEMGPTGVLKCIDEVAKAIEWGKESKSDDPNKVRGKGFALVWKAPAMPANESSAAFIKFNEDGSINVLVSGMELGQGFMTAMGKIAAEELGLPLEKVRVELPDTDRNPYEWQTVASHVTWSCGNAVRRAAIDARNQIIKVVSMAHHIEEASLYLEDGKVRCSTKPDFALPLEKFVINGVQMSDGTFRGGPILGRGSFMPEFTSAKVDPETGMGGHPNVHYTTGAGAVEIEIDKETGRVRILRMAEAFDAGKAINPDLVKGQIEGGFVQGLGTALWEEVIFDEQGRIRNPNFTDYKIPTSLDAPREMHSIIVEVPQPDGPFGARGVGEHTMIPVMPAVANAIENALGVRIKNPPMTAEKIVQALKEKTGRSP
jgi:carbon-monoxide dehydrogenase large subunit